MKKIIILILSITCTTLYSQCLQYTYDAAGNRVQRTLIPCLIPPNDDALALINQNEDETEVTQEKLEIYEEIQKTIQVFPNPAEDHLQVSFTQELLDSSIELLDLTGRVLLKQPINGLSHSFDLTTHSPGEYILLIRGEDFVGHWKIVKIRD